MSSRIKFLLCLVAYTFVMRIMPYLATQYNFKVDSTVYFYPWNIMPLTGVCLFAGAYCMTDRRWAMGAPLVSLLLSDFAIWGITGQYAWGFPADSWAVFVSFALAIFLGQGLAKRSWPLRGLEAAGRGLFAEVIFFLLTNFAYFQTQDLHPQTFAGLLGCYADGIPFAIRSFVSTAFYSVLLVSPLVVRIIGAEQPVARQTEAVASAS